MVVQSPRVLLLDIETSPNLGYFWRLFDENIAIEQIVKPSRTICWGAKWLGEREFLYADERGGKKKMFRAVHKLLSECDGVIHFNGDHFDLPKLNGEFVLHRIPPVPPLTSLDLCKTVKGLGYASGKLAFVAPYLKIGEKIKHGGFPLWRGCMEGDKGCWSRMETYNKGDVTLLDPFYMLLRPYMKSHPRLYDAGCPRCGCEKTKGPIRYRKTAVYRFPLYQCASCKGWYQGKRQSLRLAA